MLPPKKFFQDYAKQRRIPMEERKILTEYLQCQILKALSACSFNDKLSFLGGTCLRFAYNLDRFSEDLDFDLLAGRKSFNFDFLIGEIVESVRLWGFELDIKTKTTKNVHTAYFKFKNVLKEFGIPASRNEKLLVKFEIDFDPPAGIRTESVIIDSYNERFPLLVNDLKTVFAQKILALKGRPYQKGRDFYDLVWFLGQKSLEPEYEIFRKKKLMIENRKELAGELRKIFKKSDLKQAAKDVERFLFYPQKAEWILNLPKYLEDYVKHNQK